MTKKESYYRLERIVLSALLISFILLTFNYLHAQTRYSWEGYGIAPNQKFRALTLFVNIIYDINPDRNYVESSEFWPIATREGINNAPRPTYMLELLDTIYNPQNLRGTMTRIYGESSFDALQITGDFMVVNIKESSILAKGNFGSRNIIHAVIDQINRNGGLKAIYQHNNIEDYALPGESSIFFAQFLVRNISQSYGGSSIGSGLVSPTLLKGEKLLINGTEYPFSGRGSFQCVGNSNVGINPTSILMHELSHLLFGGNEFHTTGGNHRGSGNIFMPFISIQGGYGLMGSNGSSLVCCNGYERWRMHWKHPEAIDFISAHDANNQQSIPSDITRENGNCSFTLRDFITTGDVIRIKLPYKDSENSSNQYIWLENHQVGKNNKLDFMQFSENDCRPKGSAGIYAYYQVGRDDLSRSDMHERDNLRAIPAEGFWNYALVVDTAAPYQYQCINWGTYNYHHRREDANPFGGYHDMEEFFTPDDNAKKLTLNHRKHTWRIEKNGRYWDNLPSYGDDSDAFSQHTKLNMGTNPSTCNTRTYYNYLSYSGASNSTRMADKNTTITYLSGLSIEMVPQENGTFLVHIRWDDYNITNSAIWTGNISLRERAVLTQGNSLTITQNLTPAQFDRDIESGYFAPTSRWVCEAGSDFLQEAGSVVSIEEKSVLEIDSNAQFTLTEGATLRIKRGSTLQLNEGATLTLSSGSKLIVNAGATLIDNGKIIQGSKAKITIRRGGKHIRQKN